MERTFIKMKLTLLSLIFITSMSCNESSRQSNFKADNLIEFDTISVSDRYHLEGDTAKPYCDISVEFVYPTVSEKTDLDTLQKFFVSSMFGSSFESLSPEIAVETYVKNYIENYSQDADMYRESAEDLNSFAELISDMNVSESHNSFYSYYESLSDSVVYNKYKVLSFQVKQSNNKRGTVATYISYSNFVYNLSTGKQITESEIFNPGYDQALQSLIITSLLEQNNVKSVEELEDLGFFGITEIVPNSNFLLNERGIIYTYNKGEYSAYQLNAPEVFIPYKAIRSLLIENTVVSDLADL